MTTHSTKRPFTGCRPNERIATALVLEGNLGLRISDILKLRPSDIVYDGGRYRLDLIEQKTGKRRTFTVPLVIQQYIENFCLRRGIKANELIFPITERTVQKQLVQSTCFPYVFQQINYTRKQQTEQPLRSPGLAFIGA